MPNTNTSNTSDKNTEPSNTNKNTNIEVQHPDLTVRFVHTNKKPPTNPPILNKE